jgi:hypothetical protein
MTPVSEGRGGGVAAHLPAVKVAGGLHGVGGAGMSDGGGCVAVRGRRPNRGGEEGAGRPGGEGG